jgi:hypothetical protein
MNFEDQKLEQRIRDVEPERDQYRAALEVSKAFAQRFTTHEPSCVTWLDAAESRCDCVKGEARRVLRTIEDVLHA